MRELFATRLESESVKLQQQCFDQIKEYKDTDPREYRDVNNSLCFTFDDIACDLITRIVEKRVCEIADEIGIDFDSYNDDYLDFIEVDTRYAIWDKIYATPEYKQLFDYNTDKFLEE